MSRAVSGQRSLATPPDGATSRSGPTTTPPSSAKVAGASFTFGEAARPAFELPRLQASALAPRSGLEPEPGPFSPPGLEYFQRLDVSAGSTTVASNSEYEGALLLRSGAAIAFLNEAPPAFATKVARHEYEAQRRAAATLLVYIAMFMKVNTDAARKTPPTLSLEQLQRYLPFAEGEGLEAELTAREAHVLKLLELAQRELPGPRIDGFVDASVARLEVQRTGEVSDATFAVLLDGLRGKDGMFVLITHMAATSGALTDTQERALFERAKAVVKRQKRGGGSDFDVDKAPFAQQASLTMLADMYLEQAARRVRLEKGGPTVRAMRFMFGGGGAARAMLRLALKVEEKRAAAGPAWPMAEVVRERLGIIEAMTAAIAEGDGAAVQRLLFKLAGPRFAAVSTCAACHTRPSGL